jgi:hypothetical protein
MISFDIQSFVQMMVRFAINIFVLFVIVRLIYYPLTKRKDYLFTYFLIGTMVFFISYLLEGVKIKLGLALGLFAVFRIIRYRTDSVPIKEMTYLFIVIGLSIINALSGRELDLVLILFTNLAVILITYVLEKVWLLKNESNKIIVYDRIDLIKPDKRAELLEDLKQRTGINIVRFAIGRIDFVRNTVRIKIYYFETPEEAGFEAEGDAWKNADEF